VSAPVPTRIERALVLQPAFIGDVILALPIAQKIREAYPDAEIHFLVRKGNESLLRNHPAVDKTWVWDKQKDKYKGLYRLTQELRKHRFTVAVNPHRFASTGLVMAALRADVKIGFDKNPLSRLYDLRLPHTLGHKGDAHYLHEVDRNGSLVDAITQPGRERPRLYPSAQDYAAVAPYVAQRPYLVLAPASVWFTKQWHEVKWRELLLQVPRHITVYLVGAPGDTELCHRLLDAHPRAVNLAGKLSLLQTAALMSNAQRVIVNDSAPLHMASAMNAPTTAIFCSTIPEFGFGPLSDDALVAQAPEPLPCRPCGLHGHKMCPQGHFDCALRVDTGQVLRSFGAEPYSL